MSQRIERQRAFLHFLWTTDDTQRKKIIGMASEDQLKAFREITLNIYMGHLIVSGYYRTKLARYKTIIQSLCDRGVGNIRIKKLLQKNQEIIPLILNPYFKRDGGRISTRKKNNLRSDEGETD